MVISSSRPPIGLFFVLGVLFGQSLFADTERGKELYSQVCFVCHGVDLEGGKGPALADSYWRNGSSPEAILKVLNDGIEGTEMIGYKAVFPDKDRQSLLEYLLSKQKGVRELQREEYENVYFEGQKLTPELFAGREASNAKVVPENTFWAGNRFGGAIRYSGRFYAWDEGNYMFNLNSPGRTVVYLDDKLITQIGEGFSKADRFIKPLPLKIGVYDLEILHESKPKHGHRIGGNYGIDGQKRIQFHGRSLQGNLPKFVNADPTRAIVVRKWIRGVPPRSLLCLLPNKVIVAYNPDTGLIEKAWQGARVNQTPSLPDRSASPSEIVGQEIQSLTQATAFGDHTQFLGYRVDGTTIKIRLSNNDKETIVNISAQGGNSYQISQ